MSWSPLPLAITHFVQSLPLLLPVQLLTSSLCLCLQNSEASPLPHKPLHYSTFILFRVVKFYIYCGISFIIGNLTCFFLTLLNFYLDCYLLMSGYKAACSEWPTQYDFFWKRSDNIRSCRSRSRCRLCTQRSIARVGGLGSSFCPPRVSPTGLQKSTFRYFVILLFIKKLLK